MLKNNDIEETLQRVTDRVLDAFDGAVKDEIEALHAKLLDAHERNQPLAVAEAGIAILHLMTLVAMSGKGLGVTCDIAFDASMDRFEDLMQRIIDGSYNQAQTVELTERNMQRFFTRLAEKGARSPGFTGPGGAA